MELKCVLVLALIPLVTASPHGYGVKGGAGAAAKAEAAAGAGAFAGIPLAIPNGAGYSGSFAKSSSSSFAASSASSSASSFSFSGSGTVGAGANGPSSAGGSGAGSEGCNGNCKNGNNIIPDTSGAGSNQAYSGGKAAAGSGAVAIAGAPHGKNDYQPPCSSGDCSAKSTSDCDNSSCGETTPNNQKCTSEKCEPPSQAKNTKEKCTSGQCSPYSPESAPSQVDDDIPVNVAAAGPKTLQNSNGQPNKYYTKPSDNEPSQLYPSNPNKPTTYLTAPKEDTCTSAGCAPISSRPGPGFVYDKEKPNSYNVPILGPNYAPSTQNTVPCLSGICKSNQPVSPPSSLPSGLNGPGSICTSGSCQNYPNHQINTGSPGVPSSHKPLGPSGVPPVVPSSGDKNPSYASSAVPSNSVFVNTGAEVSSNAVGNFGSAKPTTTSSDKKLPSYTGGFGGPSGILKPNDFSAPNKIHISSYKPAQPSGPIASVPCTSGNCDARPTKPETNIPICSTGNCGGPQIPVFSNENPSIHPPSQPFACSSGNCGVSPGSSPIQHSPPVSFNLPSATVNFGAPSGLLKPNDFSKPGIIPTPTQENYNPPGFPSVRPDQANEPSTVKPVGTPICSYGNCGDQASSSGTYSPSLPLKPHTQTAPGGFGGPAGILKPNDFNKPLTPSYKPTPAAPGNYNPPGLSSPQHDQSKIPNIPHYKPAESSGASSCSASNCGYQPPQPQFGSAAVAQTYPTLCGSGKCEPQPTTGAYNPAYCSSGNCGTNQLSPIPSTQANPLSPDLNQPEMSGSYHSTFQSSPSSSNYGPSQLPSQSHSSAGTVASVSLNPSCTSGKCKNEQPSSQYDSTDSKPASSANTYSPHPCPAGNCGAPNNIPNISSTSTGTVLSTTCSSGNCGVNPVLGHSTPHYNQAGSTNVAVGAVASAAAVAYTGGFGGPPGLLKPYDGGKFSSPKGPLGAALHGSAVQSYYGKSLNGIDSSQSGAGAQATAVAGAAAGSYAGHGNLGGHSGQGGCTSGCGSQGGANLGHNGGLDGFGALSAAGASAKSVAGAFGGGSAGTYGQAGSFATSSATAHASAGAARKGGYGKR